MPKSPVLVQIDPYVHIGRMPNSQDGTSGPGSRNFRWSVGGREWLSIESNGPKAESMIIILDKIIINC